MTITRNTLLLLFSFVVAVALIGCTSSAPNSQRDGSPSLAHISKPYHAEAMAAFASAKHFMATSRMDTASLDLSHPSISHFCPPQEIVYDWCVTFPGKDNPTLIAVRNNGQCWLITTATSSNSNKLANTPFYYLHAGGPHLIVGFDTLPESNRLSMTFLLSSDGFSSFRLTNQEPTTILIWNVRTQFRSTNTVTKEVTWVTKHDDYPSINPSAKLAPGGVATLHVPYARPTPWRLCLIYSKEQQHRNSTNRGIFGNYEVVSKEIDE
jgi:hypothetical protein